MPGVSEESIAPLLIEIGMIGPPSSTMIDVQGDDVEMASEENNGNSNNGRLPPAGATGGNRCQNIQSGTRKFTEHQRELIQIIAQALDELGLKQSVNTLLLEANVVLEAEEAAKLRDSIKRGIWDEAIKRVTNLERFLPEERREKTIGKMKWSINVERVKEMSRHYDHSGAMLTVHKDMKPTTMEQHQQLKKLMWDLVSHQELEPDRLGRENIKARKRLLMDLQKHFPPEIMLPPGRLSTLLHQAATHQNRRCEMHVSDFKPSLHDHRRRNCSHAPQTKQIRQGSLLVDHRCPRKEFPTYIVQRLFDHSDEVWYATFSPDGNTLATGCKDGTIGIWNVDTVSHRVSLRKMINNRPSEVARIRWSPNGQYILCTGIDNCKEAHVYDVNTETLTKRFSRSNDDKLTTSSWFHDSKRFVVGGITGKFFRHSLETGNTDEWEGVRVRDIHVLSDDRILISDNLKRIRGFTFTNYRSWDMITEENGIVSFTVNKTEDMLLANVMGQGMHLWSLTTCTILGRFRGSPHRLFLNYSTFGGPTDEFLASGCEGGFLYIWKRSRDLPLVVASGHRATINCLAWHPTNFRMLISVSDDGTVVSWGPESFTLKAPEMKIPEGHIYDGPHSD